MRVIFEQEQGKEKPYVEMFRKFLSKQVSTTEQMEERRDILCMDFACENGLKVELGEKAVFTTIF